MFHLSIPWKKFDKLCSLHVFFEDWKRHIPVPSSLLYSLQETWLGYPTEIIFSQENTIYPVATMLHLLCQIRWWYLLNSGLFIDIILWFTTLARSLWNPLQKEVDIKIKLTSVLRTLSCIQIYKLLLISPGLYDLHD